MCFSLVFACLSVRLWAGYQKPCPATPTCPTLGTEPGIGMVPNFGGSQQAGRGPPLWLQRPVCVRASARVCTRGTCAQVCTRDRVTSQRQAGLLETRPAWGG